MKTRVLLLLLTSLLVFLTGCDNSTPAKNQQALYKIIKVKNVAWMREKLPAETFAYARIPNLWQMFFEAKADGLHSVQKQDAHKKIISGIKKGFVDTYASKLPKDAQLPFETLLKNMSSPLEIAVINAADGSMVPSIMIATTLQNTSKDDVTEMLNLLVKQNSKQVRITQGLDDNGFASIFVAMAPVFLSFDDKTGHLLMLSGLTASQKQLQELLANKEHATELDDIFAFENSVDASGNNLQTWINVDALYQHNKAMIPTSKRPMLEKMGVDKMKFLWVGTASSAGKSELIFKLSMPEAGARVFVASAGSSFDVQTAGVPRSAWQITRPSIAQIKNAYEFALTFMPNASNVRDKTNEIITMASNYFGVDIAKMLTVYGRTILVITDDSGTWFASKIKDKKGNDEIIAVFKEKFNLTLETKSLAGVAIDVMEVSSNEMTKQFLKDLNLNDPSFDNPFLDMKQKSYFQIKGDTYIQAFVPQVLADRDNSKNKQKFSNWLTNQQGQDWSHSLLAYTVEVQDAPRSTYHVYLKVLELIGNFANSEVDLFTLPTADQLNLPKKGQFSIALDADEGGFSIKTSYRYSIFENMSYFDGYLAVIYLGALSAYAIPAYRDYTLKTKIFKKTSSYEKEKTFIADYYANNNQFPDEELISSSLQIAGEYEYSADTGELSVYFSANDDAALQYDKILFIPEVDEEDNSIYWECYSTVNYNYMPDGCYLLEE